MSPWREGTRAAERLPSFSAQQRQFGTDSGWEFVHQLPQPTHATTSTSAGSTLTLRLRIRRLNEFAYRNSIPAPSVSRTLG
jgi:hypothetical protein